MAKVQKISAKVSTPAMSKAAVAFKSAKAAPAQHHVSAKAVANHMSAAASQGRAMVAMQHRVK